MSPSVTRRTNPRTGRKEYDSSTFLARHMDKFRVLTALGGTAGLLAIVGFLAHIQTQLDRNCDASASIGTSVIGVISVDNELSKAANAPLRDSLIRTLKVNRERCSK